MSKNQIVLFSIFLLLVITLFFIELIGDLTDMAGWMMTIEEVLEIVLMLMSIAGLAYLLRLNKQRQKSIVNLEQQLTTANSQLEKAGRAYSEAIIKQLQDWGLTSSEQEVALMLLKGLSFKEIASLRNTQEKTVRQQATVVYDKSGLKGRHEFSAWFFDGFIS